MPDRRSLLALMAAAAAAGPARAASPTEVTARRRAVESGLLQRVALEGQAQSRFSICDRMRRYGVPAVSLAVIDRGRIDWSAAYALEARAGRPISEQTLFQAASISKSFTGALAMRLAQAGKLDLDVPVEDYLPIDLPRGEQTSDHPATLRHLLAHSAGATAGGFDGYEMGAALPTDRQVVLGEAPANSPPVRIATRPDTGYAYSGGGYAIAELAMETHMGVEFGALMDAWVLRPLALTRSTFAQPLPATLRTDIAPGHLYDASEVPGGAHAYPEQAAAGLWSTPGDLARFALAIRAAWLGGTAFLSRSAARQYLTPHFENYAMGLAVLGEGPQRRFIHQGGNVGYKCRYLLFLESGSGVAVMTNSDNGMVLANEIIQAVSDIYDWPDFKPRRETPVSPDRAALDPFLGAWRFDRFEDRYPNRVDFVRHGEGYALATPDLGLLALVATGTRQLVAQDGGATIAFSGEGAARKMTVSGRPASPLSVGGQGPGTQGR